MNAAFSWLLVLGISLGSSAALFGQTGPALEASLPDPRRLPAGAPVEEPAPPPREVANPLDLLPSSPPGEESAPMPREQTPAPPPLVLPSVSRAAVPIELQRLHQEIEGLRLEREAMLLEEMDLITAKEVKASKDDDVAKLRRRVTEMLLKAAQQSKQAASRETKAKPEEPRISASTAKPPAPSPPAPLPPVGGEGSKQPPQSEGGGSKRLPSPPAGGRGVGGEGGKQPSKQPEIPSKVLTDAPVDPLSLAQSLFLAGDHEAALNAYRQLEQADQKPDEHVAIQYMIACCLRKLGKLDEATLLYREVANSGGNDILVENAQWYLRAIKDRRELEGQLDELRQRRQAIMPRKP